MAQERRCEERMWIIVGVGGEVEAVVVEGRVSGRV